MFVDQLVAPAARAVGKRPVRSDFDLPDPPSEEEQFWYFGRQQRWMLAYQAVSFVLVGFSATRWRSARRRS